MSWVGWVALAVLLAVVLVATGVALIVTVAP